MINPRLCHWAELNRAFSPEARILTKRAIKKELNIQHFGF